ncbi:MAG: DUF3365 domain-containing protein [Aquificae bacterium]|nr:DUF3365 domain-containing protein [Aquificota bacterium]
MGKAGVGLLTAVGFLFFSCGLNQSSTTEIPPQKLETVKQIGETASTTLLKRLKKELKTALTSQGPVGAIETCSKKALTITKEVAQEVKGVKEIKRTSFKYRNPLNKPDQYEAEALKFFEESMKKTGKLPPYYVQKVNGEYRYYKPLKVMPVCLICHGDPQKMNPAVVKKLKELYPEDKAVGYKEGDFRGGIRVSIPEEVVEKSSN